MKVFDTQSQTLKELIPLEGNKIKMYVCGPTVYDFPHLGHARCYITWDVVYRYLKFRGYDVVYVRNITDIDDKIINKAKETNSTPEQIADKYYLEFKNTMDELNVSEPDFEPKATENINEMIDIINSLCEKGFAYTANGDVYFDVSRFQKYGRLSRQNLDDLKAGARVETSEKKKSPLDFALWKSIKDENEISWDSPWGKGRPGWHIECSAMSRKFLGEMIDIHAGGQDLIFPHHENEKAQSEAAFGKDFVRFWMHNGFVRINEEKMSKSLGNFLTIKDVLKKYDANTIRFFILTNQYRMPVEFSEQALESAKNGVARLKNAYNSVKEKLGEERIKESMKKLAFLFDEMSKTGHIPFHEIDKIPVSEEAISGVTDKLIVNFRNFINAMDDDFNTPKALSVLFEVSGCANKAITSESSEYSTYCIALLLKLSETLGFNLEKEEKPADEKLSEIMDVLISVRQMAREQKNWEMSDKIRDELSQIGITLKDHKDKKTTWSFSK